MEFFAWLLFLQMPARLPATARVIQARTPTPYDQSALKLEVGDLIKVLEMNPSGRWKGEHVDGREGYFPFTHVELVDDGGAGVDSGGSGRAS